MTLDEVIRWIREVLEVEHRYLLCRLDPAQEVAAMEMRPEMFSKFTFRASIGTPLRASDTISEGLRSQRKDARLRPLFKVELREHPKFGTYARAFLGSNINTGLLCQDAWLLKPVDGAWKITTTLSPCPCVGMGVLDGKKHGECKGYGWKYRGFGEEPCRPPGKLVAVERLLEPDERYRPAYYAD